MQTLETMVWIAGALHVGLLVAGAMVPQVLDWREQLKPLSELSRHVVWVHGVFIVMVIIGFGLICLINASALTQGTLLARSVCGLIASFWAARLGVQLFLFDARPYLRNRFLTIGYHGLTVVFTYIAVVLAWTALAPSVGVIE